MSRRLTPADYEDLERERCRYVPNGRHSLLMYADGPQATGQITCENRGCPVDAIHPSFSGRPYHARRTAPQPQVQPAVLKRSGRVRLWPWLLSAGGAAFLYGRLRGWSP